MIFLLRVYVHFLYAYLLVGQLDTINMAGIPVRGASGVGGGFEIMQKYKIDKKIFLTSDLSAILMGISDLSNVIRGDELV